MVNTLSPVVAQLPWAASDQENKRFSRITLMCLALTLCFAGVVKWQDIPPVSRQAKEKLPQQLTRIIKAVAVKKVEPPKPVKPEPVPEVKKPEPEKVIPKPVEKAKPKPVAVKPTPSKAELAEQARKKASQSGLLAFKDQIASMRDKVEVNNNADTKLVKGAGKTDQSQRKYVGKQVASKSTGIQSQQLSSDIGAAGTLEGRKTTEFVAPVEGLPSLAQKELVTEHAVAGGRTTESIRKVLDANKAGVYAIYRRALRQDASLQGKVTVKLVIAPNGSLLECSLVSSELNNSDLENRLLQRIKAIDFGSENVSQTELEYTFNFLPF